MLAHSETNGDMVTVEPNPATPLETIYVLPGNKLFLLFRVKSTSEKHTTGPCMSVFKYSYIFVQECVEVYVCIYMCVSVWYGVCGMGVQYV